MEELPVIKATDEHRSYILSTWVKSYETFARRLLLSGMRLPQELYRSGESRLAENKWNLSSVVTSPGDSYAIHGWVCGEPGRLYHVYVPPQLRGCGVARALVESTVGKEYSTHKPWPTTPKGHVVSWSPYL